MGNTANAHPNREQENQALKPFIMIVMKNSSSQSGISLALEMGEKTGSCG
jgi:hypothetical protein